MWLEYHTRNDEDIFQNIVEQETAERLIKYIGIDEEHIRNHIYWELGLGFEPYLDLREPASSMVFDVLEEHLCNPINRTVWNDKLSKLGEKIKKAISLLENNTISQMIQPDLNEDEIQQFIELGNKIILKTDIMNRNYNKNYKEYNDDWGNLGYYKKYLTHCAKVYIGLSPNKLTISFLKGSKKGDWVERSSAAKFLREFHNMANKMLISINAKPFTDKNFKTVCEEIRKEHTKKLNNQTA